MPPFGGHIAHYLHHTARAPKSEAEIGVLILLGELNAAAAGADDSKHPSLEGLDLSYPRETTGLR